MMEEEAEGGLTAEEARQERDIQNIKLAATDGTVHDRFAWLAAGGCSHGSSCGKDNKNWSGELHSSVEKLALKKARKFSST